MSQWTHVNASFRLDSFEKIEDEEIYKVFGKPVLFDDLMDLYEQKENTKTLPMGSEGSLNMSIWHNPKESHTASTTVAVFGDLRDYNSFDELEEWFNKTCDEFWIRQAVMQVEVECEGEKLFTYKEE